MEIHQNITEGTLNDSNMAAKFRDSQVVIGNLKTGKLNLVHPKPIKVPYLIRELLDWVNVRDDLNPIILAESFIMNLLGFIHLWTVTVELQEH